MNSVSIRIAALFALAAGAISVPPATLAQSAAQSSEDQTVRAPEAETGPDETRDERLDRLFADLGVAGAEAAEPIVAEIRSIWGRSGSDSMDLLLKRGRKAINDKAFDRARAHLGALTRLAPDFAEGWNASATLYYLQEDFWSAAVDVEQALRLEPRHFSALSGLAMILERVGRKSAAIETWREVERLYPALDRAREAIERLSPEVDGQTL